MTEAATVHLSDKGASASVFIDPFSNRIRVDEYEGQPEAVLRLIEGSKYHWVEKVILKTRAPDRQEFMQAGYREEAMVLGYFKGEDMHFLVRYTDPGRELPVESLEQEEHIRKMIARSEPARSADPDLAMPVGYSEAEELSSVFRQVFQVYPTPVEDPTYIRKTMQEGTLYHVIREHGRVVSVGSAEVDLKWANAELTDCATLTEASGKGYMHSIMARIDRELSQKGIRSRYSIARAVSYPMNIIFHRLGYTCTGCLKKNVRIGTGLENMNVWSKFDG